MAESSTRLRRAARGLALAVLTCTPGSSLAASISSIEVSPALPGTTDLASLQVELFYPSTGFSVGNFETTFLDNGDIRLDIFVDSPAPGDIVLPVVGSEIVAAPLGLLPEANYSYTARLFEIPRGTSIPFFQEAESGSFSVVPEPATVHLVAAGLLMFLGIRRRLTPIRHTGTPQTSACSFRSAR